MKSVLLRSLLLLLCSNLPFSGCAKTCAPGYGVVNNTCKPVVTDTPAGAAAPADTAGAADGLPGSTATRTNAVGQAGSSSAAEGRNGSSSAASAPSAVAGSRAQASGTQNGSSGADAGSSASTPNDMSASSGGDMGAAPAAACAGRAGETVCDGSVMHQCNDAGEATASETCMSEAFCQIGSPGGACAQCSPGTFLCEGEQLRECASDGQWLDKELCVSAALCKETAGACTEMVCMPNAKSCDASGTLLTCNADGSDFASEQRCGAGLCDSMKASCNKCIPGSKQCEGNAVLTCNADGQTSTRQTCEAPSECAMASCGGSGACRSTNKGRGEPCASGTKFCDGRGGCELGCLDDGDCRNAEQMCDARNQCVARPTCGNMRPDPGENCENTPDGWFAQAGERCVNCQLTDAIYTLPCNSPGEAWPGSIWTCSNLGNATVQCSSKASCVTSSGNGDCLPFGPAGGQVTFCARPCEQGCPKEAPCQMPPDGPRGGVCAPHGFVAWPP